MDISTSPQAEISRLVPGVRIVRLPDALRPGIEPGTEIPHVAVDVMRVEVTRVNTGSSQYSITLNNWFDSLPADRSDYQNSVAATERLGSAGRPRQPRYKYNDFDVLRFGVRLRIDMGYRERGEGRKGWVPMIAGPITDMRFNFTDAGAQITLTGEDDLSQLKDKQKERVEFPKHCERRIVESVLRKSGYPLQQIAAGKVAWAKFAEDDAEGISESLQKGQSYFELLQKIADPLDFEIFLEFNDLDNPDGGQSFHFEPCRSRLPPDKTLRGIYVLRREVNLLEFNPTIKVVEQYSSVELAGKHRDRLKPVPVREQVAFDILNDELHIDPAQDRPLASGPEVRGVFFRGRPPNEYSETATNIDPARARWRAESALRKKAREFMTIEGTTLGLPRLRPGNHVEIRGVRPPFDGFFYVSKTVHSFGADGFRTRFTACRPGMPLPPYGEP